MHEFLAATSTTHGTGGRSGGNSECSWQLGKNSMWCGMTEGSRTRTLKVPLDSSLILAQAL